MKDSIISYYGKRSDIFIELEDSFGGPRTLYPYKLKLYLNQEKLYRDKWTLILSRVQFPVIIKKKQYFTRWVKLIGDKHKKSLANYSQFYGLQRIADYRDVKKSSAGLDGWKEYVHT